MPRCSFLDDWPLVAVVSDATVKENESDSDGSMQPSQGLSVSYVKLYSLQRHAYIHTLTVPGAHLQPSRALEPPPPGRKDATSIGVLR